MTVSLGVTSGMVHCYGWLNLLFPVRVELPCHWFCSEFLCTEFLCWKGGKGWIAHSRSEKTCPKCKGENISGLVHEWEERRVGHWQAARGGVSPTMFHPSPSMYTKWGEWLKKWDCEYKQLKLVFFTGWLVSAVAIGLWLQTTGRWCSSALRGDSWGGSEIWPECLPDEITSPVWFRSASVTPQRSWRNRPERGCFELIWVDDRQS